MSSSKAEVFLEGQKVASLELKDSLITMSYQNEWVENGFAISHSLPLTGNYTARTSHNFFSNLLPEGSLRDLVCKKLQISPDNDWDLLLALGKESAGALTIVTEGYEPATDPSYQKLSPEELSKMSHERSILPAIISEESTRLSLAGAQDKIAAYFDGESYHLPLHGSPTNVILKFENDNYKQITINEVFMTRLATHLGFLTSEAWVLKTDRSPIAVFRRYDRLQETNKLIRKHQEDTCQALGRSQKIKYQKESGPSLSEVFQLITETSSEPLLDRQNLIRWQIFNIVAGNSDGHGKNLSFFRSAQMVKLTPFYDLVCTRVYTGLERNLAMSFANTFDPDLFDAKRLEEWAKEIGVSKRYLLTEAEQMLEKIPMALEQVEQEFISQYGNHGILEQIRLFILKQTKRVKERLK